MSTEQAQQELVEYLATRTNRREQEPALPSYLNLGRMVQVALIITVCTAAVWGLLYLFSGQQRPVDHDITATIMAERFVKQELASPATAEFSQTPTVERTGDTWRVTSYVDSQNVFGATLRRDFTATVKAHGLGQWELIDLDWSN